MTKIHTCVSAAAVAVALFFTATPVLGEVPNPIITGPIPQNAPPGDPSHDYIFFTSENVKDFGYVEEEFFIEGVANAYDTPPLTTGTILSSGHAYKTRIVVRRPEKAQRFNGTVILEWQNVTAGYDIDASWVGGERRALHARRLRVGRRLGPARRRPSKPVPVSGTGARFATGRST